MIRSRAIRVATLAVVSIAFASTGSAYYYYVHYPSRSAPFAPMFEKYDLGSLSNKTVTFYISDSSPSPMPAGDSFQAVVSEIRAAAEVWNQVTTSDLRLAYGGLYPAGSSQINSGISVEFSDDIPPGVFAQGAPDTRGSVTFGPNGPFVPIIHSRLQIRRDVLADPLIGSSWSELFFTTLVHEFGHTIGLQHTLTSAVMSTARTSAATKSKPLAPDDIAAISVLYPAANYLAGTGSITGTVRLSNSGVAMASVVAISPSNPAISTITNPDGTFRLDGVPPGMYSVYVHPLPPALDSEVSPANIVAPRDQNNNPLPFGPAFDTQFYPGTRDYAQAGNVFVYAGSVTPGINFSVKQRSAVGIHSVRTYGYSSSSVPIASPPVTMGLPTASTMVASGYGLLQNINTAVPGLTVSVLGTGALAQFANVHAYPPYGYIQMDVQVGNVAFAGPKHMIFSTRDDLYVLPSGFTFVAMQPPSITSVTPAVDGSGNRVVAITGTNLLPDTRILFDGLPAAVTSITSDGRLLVVPPQAPGSYRAIVTALNSDGQSSMFLQAQAPPAYFYDSADSASLTVSPGVLSSGDNVVHVVATNTNFVDGQVFVGFGSSDVVVKKITVASPTELFVNVTLNSNAFVPASAINITSGLRLLSQTLGTVITTGQ